MILIQSLLIFMDVDFHEFSWFEQIFDDFHRLLLIFMDFNDLHTFSWTQISFNLFRAREKCVFCSGRVFCSGVLRLDLSASGVLFGAAAPMRCLSVCFVRAFHVLFGVRVFVRVLLFGVLFIFCRSHRSAEIVIKPFGFGEQCSLPSMIIIYLYVRPCPPASAHPPPPARSPLPLAAGALYDYIYAYIYIYIYNGFIYIQDVYV